MNGRSSLSSREFYIYLFTEALLCVSDDSRKGIGSRVIDGLAGKDISQSENKLRLKGRVYVRHMASAKDTTEYTSDGTPREFSLTISMVRSVYYS